MTGQRFGHFEVLSLLGSGGMGVVYLARDLRLGRRVAIKVLPDGSVADERARARFRREAEALSRLNHPHIATIYDFDQQDGRDFLVMEYIEGQSLRDASPLPLPPAEIARLGVQLAEALVAAHGAGVVHLDLKPGNLMRTVDGRLKVLDFGIARLQHTESGEGTTHTGTSLHAAGTPPYMAPEQVMAGPVDHRADIYAAAATLYELATARRLFEQPRGAPLYDAILHDEPDRPSRHNRAIDPALEAALLKALQKQPGDRQQTAQDLLHDLQGCAAGHASRVVVPPPRRWGRREAALAGAAMLVAVTATGYALWPAPSRAKFHARDFVLIGDVDHPTDPLLSRATREALKITLQQSPFVNVVSSDRVVDTLRRMGRPADAVVSESAGVEICQREGIPVLIAGAMATSGGSTQITIKALEGNTGTLLFAEHAEYTNPADLFARLDDLARRVRRRLGESMESISRTSKPLAQATTGSTEALRQYTRAVDARAMGEFDKVKEPLVAALRLDPDFAMAHMKLADYYSNVAGTHELAVAEVNAAYRLRERVTTREQHLISAQYFQAHDQFEESRDTLKVLTTLYPDDFESRYELALTHYALEELKPAIAELRVAIQQNPGSVRARGSLALFLARDNQPDAALDATREALAARLDSPYLLWARGLALLGAGRVAEAREAFDRLAEAPGYYAQLAALQHARASLYEGDVEDAAKRLRSLVDASRRARAPAFEFAARALLARTAAHAGDRAAVAAESAALGRLAAGDRASPVELHDSGAIAVLAGDLPLARRQLARLAAFEAANATPLARAARLLLEGDIALAERRYAAAARLHDEALVLRPWHMYSRSRAEAREALGDWRAAADAWTAMIRARGQILQDGFPADLAVARAGSARADAHLQPAASGKDE